MEGIALTGDSKIQSWDEPKSLAQMAAASIVGGGIRCPKCGCADLRTSYRNEPFVGTLVESYERIKFCRNCGNKVVVTVTERIR